MECFIAARFEENVGANTKLRCGKCTLVYSRQLEPRTERGGAQRDWKCRVSDFGGAGTGKTYTVSMHCRHLLMDADLSVILASAYRQSRKNDLKQATGVMSASTIHRLLGLRRYFIPAGPENPIDAECSQYSTRSQCWTFRSAGICSSRLILSAQTSFWSGDHNQLPPVGPGNIAARFDSAENRPGDHSFRGRAASWPPEGKQHRNPLRPRAAERRGGHPRKDGMWSIIQRA